MLTKMPGKCLFTVSVLWVCLLFGYFGCEALEKSSEELLFGSFVANYSKEYKNDFNEMSLRFKIFQQSLVRQRALNEAEKRLGGTARYGVNKFSDLTPEEFQKFRLSPRRNLPRKHLVTPDLSDRFTSLNNTRFDWRDKGVIGPIRDQYQCGSCWAFAVVESIGSAYAIMKNEKLQHILSAQQVISCDLDPNKGLNGCNGGVLAMAFKTLQDQVILVDDSIYPFKSTSGEAFPCQSNLPNKGILLRGYLYYDNVLPSNMTHLLTIGPLTTSVNAVPWQDYLGGIVQHHCTDQFVDHAVQVVGYDFTGDIPYWIVRNTWGTGWGENGYIRILYSDDNLCGLQDEVAVVTNTASVNF